MYFCFAVSFILIGVLRQVNCLDCYVCDSQTNAKCVEKPLKDKKFVEKCPNQDDVCGMSYTSSIETLEKTGFNRSCVSVEEQHEISKYGPDRSIRRKEKDSKSRFFQLVQVTYFTCNVSLCNGHYESDSDHLKCYICSSPNAPACDYEGKTLLSMNNTFLSRCPAGSYHCAASYKMKPGETVNDVEVSRSCISEADLHNKRRILGDKLVGTENNSSKLETHLFVCNTSGCNWVFPDEHLSISCIICNDVSEPDCDLEGLKLSEDSKLLKSCPTTSPHYCTMWYKMDLRSKKTQSVVRSCVSKEDALKYKNTYGGKSLSGIYAKTDFMGRASYHMTICGSAGCNVKFPKYSLEDLNCYVCSQEVNSACTLDGQKLDSSHLKACDNPDDICSMSYRVQVNAKTFGQPLSIVRKCISRQNADRFLELYGDEHDVAVFQEESAPGVDIYMYFCYIPQCNQKFPAEHEEVLSVRPPLRCYNCDMSNEKDCAYEMTKPLRSLIVVCPNTEDYRCFMSYDIKSTGDEHFNVNRTCAPATEILALKEQYGKNLVAVEGEPDAKVDHHMFHCNYPLCNLNFPDSNHTAISCYNCTLENSQCDLKGEKLLSDSPLLTRCPSHDPHACVTVIRHNSETDEIKSLVRKCMPLVQADFYKANYGELTMFLDDKNANVGIYMSFCTEDGCNKVFPKPEYLVKKTKPVDIGAAAGQLQLPEQYEIPQSPPKDTTASNVKKDTANTACIWGGKWMAFVFSIIVSTSLSDVGTKP